MAQQTAVELLFSRLIDYKFVKGEYSYYIEDSAYLKSLFEEAKKMEANQIKDAFSEGQIDQINNQIRKLI